MGARIRSSQGSDRSRSGGASASSVRGCVGDLPRQESSADADDADRHDDPHGGEVRRDGDARRRGQGAERGRREPAHGPHPVEPLQDRPAIDALHADAVRVLRCIHDRVEHAQHQERERERRPRWRLPDRDDRERRRDARHGAHPSAAEARDQHPGEPAGEEAPDRQRGDRGPQLGVGEAQPVPDLRQPRQVDETSTPLAKNSVLTAMRADRARAALTEGIIGRLWCPSSRGARGEPALSSRRCLSFPRSRPSPATSGAASCRPTAGPARRSRARA